MLSNNWVGVGGAHDISEDGQFITGINRAREQHSHNAIFTGISRNTQSKSYIISLSECV